MLRRVADYVLDHALAGEQGRLELMGRLLDPFHRRMLQRAGIRPGWRCLEVGCGTGSVSAWMAERVWPTGEAVATDLEPGFAEPRAGGNLEVQRLDIVNDEIPPESYDLVTGRAVLHHIPGRDALVPKHASAVRPGGAHVLIEPDWVARDLADDGDEEFRLAWLAWAEASGIDYFIGSRLGRLVADSGLENVESVGEVGMFNGGSPWAHYWIATLEVLRAQLTASVHFDEDLIKRTFARWRDTGRWTMTNAYTAAVGWQPTGD